MAEHVCIPAGRVQINGDLTVPANAQGIIVFAHGSGSSRFSPRNQYVAGVLRGAGLATLLLDLLTEEEERVDLQTAELRFDIDRLAERVAIAVDWISGDEQATKLKIGCFGASTGAAAALKAAAERPLIISAVVSRGGRPDLAGSALERVKAPTLLIVGGNDVPVIGMNQEAMRQINAEKRLEIIPGATHLFEEPGALEQVAVLARQWFIDHLQSTSRLAA
jgi:dienelactone hydrolase